MGQFQGAVAVNVAHCAACAAIMIGLIQYICVSFWVSGACRSARSTDMMLKLSIKRMIVAATCMGWFHEWVFV